jgi:hypothetical protein
MSYPGVRPVPKSIGYIYPNGHKRRRTIIDRVKLRSSGKGGHYLMVIEKILWRDQREPTTVRFGYYRRERDEKKWRWGSQTTFHLEKSKTERILRLAIAKGFLNL